MAGMKIAAMIDAEISKARAEQRAAIAVVLEVVAGELLPILNEVKRLRDDVDKLKAKGENG